jgi:hypothetical protein
MCVKHVQSCPFGEMGLPSKNRWTSIPIIGHHFPYSNCHYCGICQFSTHPHLLTSKIKVCVFKWGMFSLVPRRFFFLCGGFSYAELEAKKWLQMTSSIFVNCVFWKSLQFQGIEVVIGWSWKWTHHVPRSHHKFSSIRTGSRNVPRGWEDGQRAAPQMGQVRIVLAFAMEKCIRILC